MYIVRNSPRALLVAVIPLAVIHGIMTALALNGATVNGGEMPTPDHILELYLARVAIDAGLLYGGHLLLRHWTISSRMAYALMGAFMSSIGYAIAIRNGTADIATSGTVVTIGLLPALAGAVSGFLYGQFAGLAPIAAPRRPTDEAPALPARAFEGPVRVRTSVAGIIIAATMPALLTTVLSIMVVSLLPTYFHYLTGGEGPALGMSMAAAIPAQLFLTILVATIIPSAILVLCLHHIARALNRPRALEYAAIGSVIALLCAFLLAPFTPIASVSYLVVLAAGYGALMGALYRRFAGLEPLPLPEAVIASDSSALVAVDDPARRQHTVILSN
jgi:hypothetical protein